MKKAFLLSAVILLTGCSLSEGSDISDKTESIENTVSAESAESYIPEESTAPNEPDSAPAGVTAPDRAPDTVETGGVSLVKGEYDDIKEMVSFDGEFVPLEELGYDIYEVQAENWGYPGPDAVDKELLYSFEYSFMGDMGLTYEDQRVLNIYEYNIMTGESECIAMPEDCTEIMYVDRDYILYYSASYEDMRSGNTRFYQINRASGETIDITDMNTSFQVWSSLYGANLVRCGDYIFFTRTENIRTEDGRYSEPADLLVRYSLTRNVSQTVTAAEPLGAVGDNIIIAPVGSELEQVHYTLDSIGFDFSPDRLYLDGEQIGYVVPTDRSAIFGEKYEVGRLLPSPSGNVYKPVLTANYGTRVTQFLLTESSAAVVQVSGADYSSELLIIDTKNKKAAAVPHEEGVTNYGHIRCDGDWIYFALFGDNHIIAINTAG